MERLSNSVINLVYVFFLANINLSTLGLPRDDYISVKKLLEDGTPAEIAKTLGWIVDLRQMTTLIPDGKSKQWMYYLCNIMITRQECTAIELENIIGRMVKVFMIRHTSFACGHYCTQISCKE